MALHCVNAHVEQFTCYTVNDRPACTFVHMVYCYTTHIHVYETIPNKMSQAMQLVSLAALLLEV